MTKRLLTLGVLLAFLPACRAFTPPSVTGGTASVESASDDAVRILFRLAVENANDGEVPLREADYAVLVEGVEVFRGIRSPERTLPLYSQGVIELPAAFPSSLAPAGLVGADARIVGVLKYERPGEFASSLYDAGLWQPGVAFDLPVTIGVR